MCSSSQTPMLAGARSLDPVETMETENQSDLNDSLESNSNDQSRLLKEVQGDDSNSSIILSEINVDMESITDTNPGNSVTTGIHHPNDLSLMMAIPKCNDIASSNQFQRKSNIPRTCSFELKRPGPPAVLEVEQNHHPRPEKTQQQQHVEPDLVKKQVSLQRQQKMDNSPGHGSPNSPIKPVHNLTESNELSNSETENKENKPHKRSRPHSPLRATLSLGEKTTSGFKHPLAKTKYGIRENQWRSLEVPSITVRSDDDIPNSSGSFNGHGDIMDIDENGYLETNSSVHQDMPLSPLSLHHVSSSPALRQNSLPLNYAQRQILSKSLGRTGGNKLKGSYSLDVPQCHKLHQSHSLSTLEPEKIQRKENQQFEFINIEDKLISSSLNRLEASPASSKRRLSWTPGIFPRGSKGSIHDKSFNGKCKVKYQSQGELQGRASVKRDNNSDIPDEIK